MIGFHATAPLPNRLVLNDPTGNDSIILHLRCNARARRLSLRQERSDDGFRVTVPPGMSLLQIERFIERSRPWIAAQNAAKAPPIPFEAGQRIPILGVLHAIEAYDGRQPVIRQAFPPKILVSGQPEHHGRRIRDYLIAKARRTLTQRSHRAAAILGCSVKQVRVKDMRSRWGSCSANGSLSYCWRLILAPEKVLDYVVAHEVAHRIEMNHGPHFWTLVACLCSEAKECQTWLREQAAQLLSYGRAAKPGC